MWIKMVLVGYFLVQYVDLDNGTYNILLAQKGGTPNMVATWSKYKDTYHEDEILHLRIEGECQQVYEILEGNGKIGSAWRAEDDWYLNCRPYICNSEHIEVISD